MRTWQIHKTRGTCKFVHVNAERLEFSGGAALFYIGDRLVMSYSPWAWKTIYEEKSQEPNLVR